MNHNKLLLASSSPRRQDLLSSIGIVPDKICSPDINENVRKNETPFEYVKRMSLEKACSVLEENRDYYVVAADTIVVRGTKILGKPQNAEEEHSFLKFLSGRRHKVLTSYCVIPPQENDLHISKLRKIVKVVSTGVLIKSLSDEETKWYVDTNEWQGKSGGYAIQGAFQVFVKQINGSISNVIGLPLFEVNNTLKGLGYR